MYTSISECHRDIYDLLIICRDKSIQDGLQSIQNLSRTKQNQIYDFCIEHNVFNKIAFNTNSNGDYVCQLTSGSRLTHSAYKFISLYEKYKSEGINIEVLMNDSNELILYLRKKLDKAERFNFLIGIISFAIGTIFTKFIDSLDFQVIIEIFSKFQ